jgi:hypothetical protein
MDARREAQAFHARIDAETTGARTAFEERDAAKSSDEMLRAKQLKVESDAANATRVAGPPRARWVE